MRMQLGPQSAHSDLINCVNYNETSSMWVNWPYWKCIEVIDLHKLKPIMQKFKQFKEFNQIEYKLSTKYLTHARIMLIVTFIKGDK